MDRSLWVEDKEKMEKEEFLSLVALKRVKGVGKSRILKVKERCGSLKCAFTSNNIKKFDFLNDDIKKRVKDVDISKYEFLLDVCERENIQIITYFDDSYPQELREINDSPMFLFAKGNTDLLKSEKKITLVGTREASDEALQWTYDLSNYLEKEGFVVVSGGAFGVDTKAHEGALAGSGNTICVLGSGILNPSPKKNLPLFGKISDRGLIISETLPYENANRYRLLSRNRITSALSDASVIVASKERGGAMHQINLAISQGKKVFCPDPNLNLKPTGGINQLLSENSQDVKAVNSFEEFKALLERGNGNGQITLIGYK